MSESALLHADPACPTRRLGDVLAERPGAVRCPCAHQPPVLDLSLALGELAERFSLERAMRLRAHLAALPPDVVPAARAELEALCAARRLPARRAALARAAVRATEDELHPHIRDLLELHAALRPRDPGHGVRSLGEKLLDAAGLERGDGLPAHLGRPELDRAAQRVLTDAALDHNRLDLQALHEALSRLCTTIEACWARDEARPDELVLLRHLSSGTHTSLHARALGIGELLSLAPEWYAVSLPGVLADELVVMASQLRGTGVFPAGVLPNWRELLPVALPLWLEAGGSEHEDPAPWDPEPEGLACLPEALEAARLLLTS